VNEFQTRPDCHLFITTNAGSTGLNLQAANTVINCDLPWNPAVLEQRIARAHRMGQKQPVHAFLLVTEKTLEESLLATLSAKKDLALATLDIDSDVNELSLVSGAEELRNRLEILLGAKAHAPLDASQKAEVVGVVDRQAHRDRVAAAGGELLGAVFNFLGELVSQQEIAPPPPPETVATLKHRLSEMRRRRCQRPPAPVDHAPQSRRPRQFGRDAGATARRAAITARRQTQSAHRPV
jgi:superfamily II DNA/RNA helicase